jgi:hypothetical protein
MAENENENNFDDNVRTRTSGQKMRMTLAGMIAEDGHCRLEDRDVTTQRRLSALATRTASVQTDR